jgi:hypothetical protein
VLKKGILMEPVDPRIDPALVPAGSRAIVIAEHQTDEYIALPSVRTPYGKVITRWQLTDEERRALLLGADVFLTIWSYGPINPVHLSVGPCDWSKP